MSTHVLAKYLPESMLITIGPDLRILDDHGSVIPFPSAQAFAVFFHEYVHYLHNISTASGIAAFVNTVDLWQRFRHTIKNDGESAGSVSCTPEEESHLRDLSQYLNRARQQSAVSLRQIITVDSGTVHSISLEDDVTAGAEVLLSVVKCEVELVDRGGKVERLVAKIGTLELLEGAAWLLEKKMVEAVGQGCSAALPSFFPYRIAQAVFEFRFPGIGDDAALACILAALQSSNAPEAFYQLLTHPANGRPMDIEALRTKAANAIAQHKPILDKTLRDFETEFSNDGAMAKAMRQIVKASREGFARRDQDPFFELAVVESIRTKQKTPEQVLADLLPCAVMQTNPGSLEDIKRDFLLAFGPPPKSVGDDVESFLRIMQCMLHWVNLHRSKNGFVGTEKAARRPCPFYTSCDLDLRCTNNAICREHPWKAADWSQWENEAGVCWYGTAVKITRPPNI